MLNKRKSTQQKTLGASSNIVFFPTIVLNIQTHTKTFYPTVIFRNIYVLFQQLLNKLPEQNQCSNKPLFPPILVDELSEKTSLFQTPEINKLPQHHFPQYWSLKDLAWKFPIKYNSFLSLFSVDTATTQKKIQKVREKFLGFIYQLPWKSTDQLLSLSKMYYSWWSISFSNQWRY